MENPHELATSSGPIGLPTSVMASVYHVIISQICPLLETVPFVCVNLHSIRLQRVSSSEARLLPSGTQRRMVSDVTQVANDVQIWRAFRSKEKLFIASDGGLYGNQGTFGWVITSSKQVLYQCGGPVDGPYDSANSTRSELCGLASSFLLVASLARNWGIRHRCSFRCILDSRNALCKRCSNVGPIPNNPLKQIC